MFLKFFQDQNNIFLLLSYVMTVNVVTCMKMGDLICLSVEEIGFHA